MIDTAKRFLLRMRDEELARMIGRGGSPMIVAVNAALAALDEAPPEAEPASRAAVSDDGDTIRLTLYAETGAVAAMELDPIRAIMPAGELIDAALASLA
jgi:hypothetical protein